MASSASNPGWRPSSGPSRRATPTCSWRPHGGSTSGGFSPRGSRPPIWCRSSSSWTTGRGQINLNTSEWLILSKIDGKRSIKAIAAASNLSVFDAAKILYDLITQGLIRLRDSASDTEATTAKTQRPAPPKIAAAPTGPPELVAKLGRVRDVCNAQLGSVGESVVNKYYQKARAELDRGAGPEAIEEAVNQITRAAAILKGPSTAEILIEQLKAFR